MDFDAEGNIIGMVIVSLRHLLGQEGELRITLPEAHVPPEEFTALLPAAP